MPHPMGKEVEGIFFRVPTDFLSKMSSIAIQLK
jgi:hypothetical protein